MISNAHLPRKKKSALSSTSSAKKTALSHDAVKPIMLIASAPAPKTWTFTESETRPTQSPISAAAPGRTRIATSNVAITRKSGPARQPSNGRSV